MTEATISIEKRLESLGKKKEEYDIEDGFAIYKGTPVNYKKMKILFKIRVSEVFVEEKTNVTVETTTSKEIKKDTTKPEEPATTTKEEVKDDEEDEGDKEDRDLIYLKTYDIKEGTEKIAEKIGIFLNINGTSKTRKNLIYIKDFSFSIDELTKKLFLKDRTNGDKEKTDRSELTIERIAACYAEETSKYLKKTQEICKN